MTLITFGYDNDGNIYLDNHLNLNLEQAQLLHILQDDKTLINEYSKNLSMIKIRQGQQNTRTLIFKEDLDREVCEKIIKSLSKKILSENSFIL